MSYVYFCYKLQYLHYIFFVKIKTNKKLTSAHYYFAEYYTPLVTIISKYVIYNLFSLHFNRIIQLSCNRIDLAYVL